MPWENSAETHIWIFNVGRGNAAFIRTGLNHGLILDMACSDEFSPAQFVRDTFSSLLKNLIRNGFSASFCDFRSARGHFRRQLQLWEASRLRDHCNSGPTHHPTACTWRFLSRQRL